MSREAEFITREKEHYGKIFVDINYSVDNVKPFMNDDRFNQRKYMKKLPVLKRYMELLGAAENADRKRGLFDIFNKDKELDLLSEYKKDNAKELKQLENCGNCKCLNCSVDCDFDVCLGCREGARVVSCDHKKINMVYHDNYSLDLVNDRTGRNERYKVVATLQDPVLDRHYIYIEGIDNDEKFVLYHYIGISEDKYGEITDEKEFDYIVSIIQSSEE